MAKTNKIVEYGFKAAEVGRILIEPQLAIPTATSDKRRQLFSMGTFYGPDGQSSYLYKNAAIIDAILELYPASNNLYSQIVTQWGTPDCQAVIKQFESKLAEPLTTRINFTVNMMSSKPDGDGWKLQESLVCDFIKRYCNRPSDLKKGKAKLRAEASRYLTLALAFHTLGQHLRLSFDDLNAYRGEARGLMEQNIDSRTRRKLVKLEKQVRHKLHYGNKVREGAHEWVCARVLSSSFTEYAAKTFQYPNKLRERIRPFDDSTEYDLHPG